MPASADTTATVQDAGGVINNNGISITIAQPFIHGGVATIDGGLVFNGSATTTLSGANAYNGPTVVNVGTLALSNASGNNIASSGSVRIAGGATLDSPACLLAHSLWAARPPKR